MTVNKIVARFKDGNVMKGETVDFFPNKSRFHIKTLDGEIIEMNMERLKAIFFVKDFGGNKQHTEEYSDEVLGGGRKMEVQFTDGEKIIGYSQGYSRERKGFFIIPADKKCNNDRIFVITSAASNIKFL